MQEPVWWQVGGAAVKEVHEKAGRGILGARQVVAGRVPVCPSGGPERGSPRQVEQ